jgi:hypothetical protein
MSKSQGFTASAIIAAGLMLRPAVSAPPVSALRQDSGAPVAEEPKRSHEEGPWLASCEYWKTARNHEPETADKKATVSIAFEEEGTRINSTVVGSAEGGISPCPVSQPRPAARWGIPKTSGSLHPEIHAIIAAVPDPLRGHHALEFDRDVDALVQAAGENGYVPSYYWLPWKSRGEASRPEDAASIEETARKSARERRPGLIVFKQVPDEKEPGYPWSDYYRVIYLFLVGETPTLGIDGPQLDNAFQYESELHEAYPNDVWFSMKANELAIIGPVFSGSAASLREGLESADAVLKGTSPPLSVNIAGSTSTKLADDLLSSPRPQGGQAGGAARTVNYKSFAENSGFEFDQLLLKLSRSGYHMERVAVLVEDSTVLGALGACSIMQNQPCNAVNASSTGTPLIIRFPREISLLRNAHTDGDEPTRPQSIPSPFLHLSLKDPGTNDSVPQFSQDHMPFSQEAQLMAISRQLQRNRIEFVAIIASNVLDQLFLSQFLHRACPDARLVFMGGDLLYERETENVPFIGSVTFTPYGLTSPTSAKGPIGPVRAFSDSGTETYFNAASYSFWNGTSDNSGPYLANYSNPLQPGSPKHPLLWATVIGTDGYYPLGIVNECASDAPHILPTITGTKPFFIDPASCSAGTASDQRSPSRDSFLTRFTRLFRLSDPHYKSRPYRYPALSWQVLCVLIGLLCIFHALAISFPNYWSPFTRDLAIAHGDQRHRRSMYIHIGTTMLFCMAFITAYPLFPSFRYIHPNWHSTSYSLGVVGAASGALIATWRKTHPYLRWRNVSEKIKPDTGRMERLRIWFDANLIFFFNTAAILALLLVPAFWVSICHTEGGLAAGEHTYVGWFFSYRCLHPSSGVSPLVPVLLVLFGWYLWAVLQGLRLRFSEKTRPHLPRSVAGKSKWPLFVSDETISHCGEESRGCLTSNITCFLITREVVRRFFPRPKWWPTLCLIGLYLSLFCVLIFGLKLESVDRFLWQSGFGPTPYELLTAALAFPLVVIGLAGWLRAILIWGSLKRDLLEPLERMPIRYAFARLQAVGWMSMMRQGGLLEHWRDMARSTESIRQMVHDPALLKGFYPDHKNEKDAIVKVQMELEGHIKQIYKTIETKETNSETQGPEVEQADLNCICEMEKCCARFSEALEDCRDIARSTGSMRQMVQDPERFNGFHSDHESQKTVTVEAQIELDGLIEKVCKAIQARKQNSKTRSQEVAQVGLNCVYGIEKCYAKFSEALLKGVLIPYWEDARIGLVNDRDFDEHQIEARSMTNGEAISKSQEPLHIRVAEEFLAIRYVSLIRAVLVNMRYLLMFVSAVFVLTIVAWNSYPFQPRQWIDEAFTGLLLLMGTGIISIFVQMYRNPLLSRITDTKANELGIDFYLRMVTFGTVPVLTWLVYQFPDLGSSLWKFIQPTLEVMK